MSEQDLMVVAEVNGHPTLCSIRRRSANDKRFLVRVLEGECLDLVIWIDANLVTEAVAAAKLRELIAGRVKTKAVLPPGWRIEYGAQRAVLFDATGKEVGEVCKSNSWEYLHYASDIGGDCLDGIDDAVECLLERVAEDDEG